MAAFNEIDCNLNVILTPSTEESVSSIYLSFDKSFVPVSKEFSSEYAPSVSTFHMVKKSFYLRSNSSFKYSTFGSPNISLVTSLGIHHLATSFDSCISSSAIDID